MSLAINDTVWYCADPLGCTKFLAIIKYIGPVPQLGQGYYFGLDLLVIFIEIFYLILSFLYFSLIIF